MPSNNTPEVLLAEPTTGFDSGDKSDARSLDPGGKAALGINTKSPAVFIDARREKYGLQRAAAQLLQGFRVEKCHHFPTPNRHISILYTSEHQKAFYSGLITCGSIWHCPVCAAKISERRRVEVQHAIAMHEASGGEVLLVSLTNAHYHGDDLNALLEGQSRAMRRFLSGTRAMVALFDSIGCIGQIRALEVTYGEANGWHPHFHILLFVRSGLDLDRLRQQLFIHWHRACELAKLPLPSFTHGVKVDGGHAASDYITKGARSKDEGWGLDQEITKGHIKKGRKDRATPFDLLRMYRDGDKRAGALFRVYAEAFKGKRQLVWSKGLKALFCVEDISDEALAERDEEDAQWVYGLTPLDWKAIIFADARAQILEAYESSGKEEVNRVLVILRRDYLIHQSTFQTGPK